MKRNKILTMILSIGIIMVVVGVSYAFFAYGKTGLYTHTINGGKMSVIYDEVTGNNITIDNAYPLTDEEALTKAMEFEFTITGYNESEKNVYYQIEMDHGSDVSGKNRFLDSDMKISLFENNNLVYENQVFDNLDNQSIHYGYINYGTSSASPVTNSYLLRIWINDDVFITNTPEEFETTGKSVYSTDEFANSYGNFKVNVIADLTYDEIGYLTYDANGGEFTPNKTSLTTGKVTTQKPVMENKGFLGWSSDRNATTPEYLAGDTYTGKEQVLYAVYGDTRNVMGVFPKSITSQAVKYMDEEYYNIAGGIIEIKFINEKQDNIDVRYNAAIVKADLTLNNQGSVKSWLEESDTSNDGDYYVLYVSSEGTTYLTDCQYMFADFPLCEEIDLTNVDTSLVTSMEGMFAGGTIVEYYEIVTSNDKDFKTIVNLSANNTADVRKLETREINYSLLNDLNLESLNYSNVINMSKMFLNSISLTNISLISSDTNQVTDMSYMFSGCEKIVFIDLENIDTRNVLSFEQMFSNCYELVELNLSNLNTNSVTNMNKMFYNSYHLTTINFDEWNTSNVENMSYIFSYCNSLEYLDLSSYNTSNVTNMSGMFSYCEKLIDIDLSSFKTMKVTDMSFMFNNCNSLIKLDLSHFDTSNVTNMSYMFGFSSWGGWEDDGLLELNLNNWDTSKVLDMSGMFSAQRKLKKLDVSSFDTSNVIDMSRMFSTCRTLEYLDVSNFNTSKVTNMSDMFGGCNSLTLLDLSSFDFSNVTFDIYNSFLSGVGYKLTDGIYTIVYVKSDVEQSLILNLGMYNVPSEWTSANVLIK